MFCGIPVFCGNSIFIWIAMLLVLIYFIIYGSISASGREHLTSQNHPLPLVKTWPLPL